METKTVIISGANGYFGGIACRYFIDTGWIVLKALRQEAADIHFDLDHPEEFARKRIKRKVDLFIHAAAAHEVTCREQPYRSIFQNVAGTRAALKFCVLNKISKFVYLSTFHVFGNPMGIIDETTVPLPTNDYGLSHLQAEEYVQMYIREKLIQGMVIRPSNFFGLPVENLLFHRWTLVPFAFCREAVETGQIVLKTPGYQQRNFVSIQDVCRVIEKSIPNMDMPLLNVPGPITISIKDFAYKVRNIINREFSRHVEVYIPDGSNQHEQFTFTSKYINSIYKPMDDIDTFVKAFVKECLGKVL